jgi:hypothetical protein
MIARILVTALLFGGMYGAAVVVGSYADAHAWEIATFLVGIFM